MSSIQYYGLGRRKQSTARVRLVPGKGKIQINKRDLEDFFALRNLWDAVKKPLDLTDMTGKFDVLCRVKGGGYSGQANAIKLGIARALLKVDPELRSLLKSQGLLTCDARVKERKKYGLKKARKASQFSKR